jgi:hypothetical protein
MDKNEAKAEKLRIQMDHLQIKFDLENRLRQAKHECDMKKLQVELMKLDLKDPDYE